MDGWTDTCQNITFPRTTYTVGNDNQLQTHAVRHNANQHSCFISRWMQLLLPDSQSAMLSHSDVTTRQSCYAIIHTTGHMKKAGSNFRDLTRVLAVILVTSVQQWLQCVNLFTLNYLTAMLKIWFQVSFASFY